jgi:hypothetical protein
MWMSSRAIRTKSLFGFSPRKKSTLPVSGLPG